MKLVLMTVFISCSIFSMDHGTEQLGYADTKQKQDEYRKRLVQLQNKIREEKNNSLESQKIDTLLDPKSTQATRDAIALVLKKYGYRR